MLNIRTILHPADFSAGSELAFDVACSLARDHGAKLVLLYVGGPTWSGPSVLPAADEGKHAVLEKLKALRAVEAAAKLAVTLQLRSGLPAEEIVEEAKESKADVIVMGTHGRAGCWPEAWRKRSFAPHLVPC